MNQAATRKIINRGKLHYVATLLKLVQGSLHYHNSAAKNKLTLEKGSQTTRQHTTMERGVLHDPATHHTSEGLSHMTWTTDTQKNSQPKVSLEHYVGHPTQLSYG